MPPQIELEVCHNSMTSSRFAGGPGTIEHKNIVHAYRASPSMSGMGYTLMGPQGSVHQFQSVDASNLHPQLAPIFIHKIYQLDYSRKSDVYRMLERFFPQVSSTVALFAVFVPIPTHTCIGNPRFPLGKAKAARAPKSTSKPTADVPFIGQDMERIDATSGGTDAWP
ncbi:hypothetical protein H0H93_003033 [Arthromyces matolae]|nr:hypothetical protein H0H93_003033 [Arthromyces matolae]